jgi:chaperonin GroES
MKYVPLGERVVIKSAPRKEKTETGIIIPESVEKEPLIEGTVVSVGAGVIQTIEGAPKLKEGDCVLYSSSAGGEIDIDGESHVIMFESDVWAIYEK